MSNAEAVPPSVVEKEFERKRASDILRHLEREDFSLAACEWAARGFASIAGQAMTQKNAESLADFLDDGGCESLVQILTRHCEMSETVAAFACLAIATLSFSMRELKEFLGEIGACEAVVFAASMHVGDARVSEFGACAIANLAKHNIANSFKLAEAGACDVLAQLGNFGFSLRHDSCVNVARNVCSAFAYLSEAVNAQRLADCGSSSLVCALTKLHFKNEGFALAAMKTLCALASLNAMHREELGRCGACEQVVEMLSLHTDCAPIALEGCEATLHLSLSPNNADKLGKAGACEMVVLLLKQRLMDVDFGTEICTGAMLNMATYGVHAQENREKLLRCGSVELLRRAQFSSKASYKARENIQNLLDLLGAENVSSKAFGNNSSNKAHNTNVKVIHGSEMKGATVPLKVEVREVIEYDSLSRRSNSDDDSDASPADGEDVSLQLSKNGYTSNNNGVFEI